MRTCICQNQNSCLSEKISCVIHVIFAAVKRSLTAQPIETSANSPHWITRTSAQQLDSRQQQTAASQLYGHNSYFITFVFLSKFPPSNAQ